MRYVTCPKCEEKLGVPDKMRGKPVECPVCKNEFIPASRSSKSKSQKSRSKKSTGAMAMRSLPVPTALAENDSSGEVESTEPSKSRLVTPGPPSPPSKKENSFDPPVVTPSVESKSKKKKSRSKKKEKAKPVAKIITTESVPPQLTKDGKLPTLQLSDDVKKNDDEKPLTENPAFLGMLICGSIIVSGLMLLLAQQQPDRTRAAVQEARQEIKRFYEVRVDEEPKPYQLDLRQAQLAHSRGDYLAETYAYQRVMLRFRTEGDDTTFKVTGSEEWDIELHELVSTLLNEAKRRSK